MVFRKIFSTLLGVLSFAQPRVLSIQKLNEDPSPYTLLTAGGDLLQLNGENFIEPLTLTYSGRSPFNSLLTISYTPIIQSVSTNSIIVQTVPGIGSALTFTITTTGFPPNTSAPLAGYIPPAISYIVPSVSLFNTNGGDLITIVGQNFGPMRFPGATSTYVPNVRYGGPSATYAWMYSCSRTAADYDFVVTCRVGSGGGTGHNIAVIHSNAGVTGPTFPAALAFNVPVIASVSSNFGRLVTGGGETVIYRGAQMPLPQWVQNGWTKITAVYGSVQNITKTCSSAPQNQNLALACPVGYLVQAVEFASYGTPTGSCQTYLYSTCHAATSQSIVEALCVGKQSCTVPANNNQFGNPCPGISKRLYVQASCQFPNNYSPLYTMPLCTASFDTDRVTRLITCTSAPGTGKGYGTNVFVDGQPSTIFRPLSGLGYAAPIITGFSGSGAEDALTTGNQFIFISGINFGNKSSLLSLEYTLTLKQPVSGIQQQTYIPTACVVSIPHTQIRCNTSAGLGSGLQWNLTVDGQNNQNPTTSYLAPIITNLTVINQQTGQPVAFASTSGGDILLITGQGFGQPFPDTSLIQSITISAPTGTILNLNTLTANVVSDSEIYAIIPPGGGQYWTASITIADLVSQPTTATFSYSPPYATSVIPARGPTQGGYTALVFGEQFPINIPNVGLAIIFGNLADGSLYPSAIPANTIINGTNYQQNTVNFIVPPGSGFNRSIWLVSYLLTDGLPLPDIASAAAGPPHTFFSYQDPEIISITVSQPQTEEEILVAKTFFPTKTLGDIRILDIFGVNFGTGSQSTIRIIEQFINNTYWEQAPLLFQYILEDWKDESIRAYTDIRSGTIRITLASTDYWGNPNNQTSNFITYADISPILIVNYTDAGPTVGGTELILAAKFLASASGFAIKIGNSLCAILDPLTRQPLLPSQIYTSIIFNPLCYSPPGPIFATTTWQFTCRVPQGVGANLPIYLTRYPDLANSTFDNILSYSPPNVQTINSQTFKPDIRYLANTRNDQILITGDNFGICPIITVATYILDWCQTIKNPASPYFDPVAFISADQKQIFMTVPPGEGIGENPGIGDGKGWKIDITVGGQSLNTSIKFGYNPPQILSIRADELPTLGGTILSLIGVNFGQAVPDWPEPLQPPDYSLLALIGNDTCSDLVRLSHNIINCSLPAGIGRKSIFLRVAGQNMTLIDGLIYDAPKITDYFMVANGSLQISGKNFGPGATTVATSSCVFLQSPLYVRQSSCNSQVDAPGEGEIWQNSVEFWNDSRIIFAPFQSTGSARLLVQVAGQTSQAQKSFLFGTPQIYDIAPLAAPTLGGTQHTLSGINFGSSENFTYPALLPLPSIRPSLSEISIVWGPPQSPVASIKPTSFTPTTVSFTVPPGVGTNISILVQIQEQTIATYRSNIISTFSYDAPRITAFQPNPLKIGKIFEPTILLQSLNLGTDALLTAYGVSTEVTVLIDGLNTTTTRITQSDNTPAIEFQIQTLAIPVGFKSTTLYAAGQNNSLSKNSSIALHMVCDQDYFGRPGEICLACPQGGLCAGYVLTFNSQRNGSIPRHTYPIPESGYFDLNSSFPGALCPASSFYEGRDVCIVPCSPSTSCLGNNQCAEGYTNTAPYYRCSTCEKGYFRRSSECKPCPNQPGLLYIGLTILLLSIIALGYFFKRFNVNIGFVSIGVDYFQVLSVFLQLKIQWPPVVQQLFYIFSAFNFNLEIIAPECFIPEVSFQQKFSAVAVIPAALLILLGIVYGSQVIYKIAVAGRNKKESLAVFFNGTPVALMLMYLFYLYVSRMMFEVWNCVPTQPPTYNADGTIIKYLQAVFEECGKPGGIQLMLAPAAVFGIIFYSIGYPIILATLLWKFNYWIVVDQYVRAAGANFRGDLDQRMLRVRELFSRIYYQFRPERVYWSLIILARKFSIAIVSSLLTANPPFQLAVILLVLFLAFAAQIKYAPYMSPSNYERVIADNKMMSLTSKWHEIHGMALANIQARALKMRPQLIRSGGKIDPYLVVKGVWIYIFDLNTIETVMLFCSCMVALLGIMYQTSNSVEVTSGGSGQDFITSLVMGVLIFSILYLSAVFLGEIAVRCWDWRSNFGQLRNKSQGSKNMNGRIPKTAIEMLPVTTSQNPLAERDLNALQLPIDPPGSEGWAEFRQAFLRSQAVLEQMRGEHFARTKSERDSFISGTSVNHQSIRRKNTFGPVKNAVGLVEKI